MHEPPPVVGSSLPAAAADVVMYLHLRHRSSHVVSLPIYWEQLRLQLMDLARLAQLGLPLMLPWYNNELRL